MTCSLAFLFIEVSLTKAKLRLDTFSILMDKNYVLRARDIEEIKRLGFQHAVWKELIDTALTLQPIASTDRILDLGGGPGYLASDLSKLIQPSNQVVCLDNSPIFIEHIKQHVKAVRPIRHDITQEWPQGVRDGIFDKVFCRWVLMFVDGAENVIRSVYKSLKPGGYFFSFEYYNFKSIGLEPNCKPFDKVFSEVYRLLRSHGGNPDIGIYMKEYMDRVGFCDIQTRTVLKSGNTKSSLWEWLSQTNTNHSNLVSAGLIRKEELDAFYNAWKRHSQNPDVSLTAAPVMITIGRKPL